MNHELLLSTSDLAAPISTAIPDTFDDEHSSARRAGLRQTDLSLQLELNSKKKHRLKTQSILYNGRVNNSKMSLQDQQSVTSGGTSVYGVNMYYNNPSIDNLHFNQEPQHHPHPHHQQQQYQQVQYQQAQYQQAQYQQAHSQQYQNQTYVQQQQQQQPQYPLYQYTYNNQQQQQQVLPKQRQKGAYRESYMYLDDGTEDPSNALQRRFSSHGVVGSPMSTPTEESKRLSFTASVIGFPVTSSQSNQRSMDYMNSLDGDGDDDWIDTDVSDRDSTKKSIARKKSNNNMFAENLQLENRTLKKKLKDMELKYEMINPNESKIDNIKLQKELDNLIEENDSLSKNLAKVKVELLKSGDKSNEVTNFSNNLLKRLPLFIPDKNVCFDLVNGIQTPISMKKQLENSLSQYDFKSTENEVTKNETVDEISKANTINDEEIMILLRNDIKILSSTITKLSLEKKQMEKVFTKKLHEERKTIRMAASHKAIHSEFKKSSNYKPNSFKGFKLIRPVLITDGQSLTSAQPTPKVIQNSRLSTISSNEDENWSDAQDDTTEDDLILPSTTSASSPAPKEGDETSLLKDVNSTTIEDEFIVKPIMTPTLSNKMDSPKSLVFETFTS